MGKSGRPPQAHGQRADLGAQILRDEQYALMYEVEDRLWWYRGMHRIFFTLLEQSNVLQPGARILDAGCGTGRLLTEYEARGASPFGVDFHPLALHYTAKRGHRRVTRGSVNALPYPDASFDLVSSIDVLEHAAVDDAAALREMQRVARPGGWVLATVPAYRWLLSAHDRAVHDARRYTARQVRALAESVDLHVEKLTYANSLLFPVAAVRRLLTRWADEAASRETEVPPRWINAALEKMLSIEQRWISRGGTLPFGLTVIVLCRR